MVSCKVDPRRKTLFAGKTFVFATEAQLQKYAEAIRYSGGRCVHADDREGVLRGAVSRGDISRLKYREIFLSISNFSNQGARKLFYNLQLVNEFMQFKCEFQID